MIGVAVRETPQLDSTLGVNMNGDCFKGNPDCCRVLPDFPRVEPWAADCIGFYSSSCS